MLGYAGIVQTVYRIVRAANGYAVEIGDPSQGGPSIRRAISGFKTEREAREWIKADQRYVVALKPSIRT